MLSDKIFNTLVNSLVDKGDLIPKLINQKFGYKFGKLYLFAYKVCGQERKEDFKQFLIDGIQSPTEIEWDNELNQEGPFIELVLEFIEDKSQLNLEVDFQTALIKHAMALLNGSQAPSRLIDRWKLLPEALSDSSKMTFLRNLRDELISQTDKSIAAPLTLYGPLLIGNEVFREKADDTVRRLFTAIINRKNEIEITWLRDFLNKDRSILEEAEKETQESFKDQIKNALSQPIPEDLIQHFRDIGGLIGLSLEEIEGLIPKPEVLEADENEADNESPEE